MSYGTSSYGDSSYGELFDTGSSGEYSEVVTENVEINDSVAPNWVSNPIISVSVTLDDGSPLNTQIGIESVGENIELLETITSLLVTPLYEIINQSDELTTNATQNIIILEDPYILDLFGYLDWLVDSTELNDTAIRNLRIDGISFEAITINSELQLYFYDSFLDAFLTSDILDYKILGEIVESFTSSDTLQNQGNFQVLVIDNLENNDRLILGLPTTITEDLNLNDTPANIRNQLGSILSNLVVDGTLTSVGSFVVNQSEVFNILDVIGTDAFEALVASLTSSDSLSIRLVASLGLTSSLSLSEALSESLERFLEAVEDFVLNDLNSTQTDGVVSVADEINISHLFDPTNMSTWVMNPENYAVYNYSFGFTETTVFDKKYLMADDTGLYELGGTTDNGETVVSSITTAALDFGAESIKQVPAVLLGTNGTDFILKVSIDGDRTARYQINYLPDELGTKRIKLGKGLIGKNWQFTLINENEEFDLDSFEFYPIVFKRKHNG